MHERREDLLALLAAGAFHYEQEVNREILEEEKPLSTKFLAF